MRTRTPLALLIIVALASTMLGSLVAVAATTGTAHACSIEGPSAVVSPTSNLQPGQRITITGRNFVDVRFDQPQPAAIAPPGSDTAIPPPPFCDFDIYPTAEVHITWRGNVTRLLGVTAGPDFTLTANVPGDAASGPATIAVGQVTLAVHVGRDVEPPPPCPLYTAEVAPDSDFAPGFPPGCPEPCVDYAHTIDDGTRYDYQGDCPNPCGQPQANPGAATNDQAAVWCPPPEPCPAYVTGEDVPQSDLAVWCPPPEPCPVYATGNAVAPPDTLVWCPDPCGSVATDAAAVWCPPPEPCPVYATGEDVPQSNAPVWCPDPCALVGGDAVWCPPPCTNNASEADGVVCPYPLPAIAESAGSTGAAPTTPPASTTADDRAVRASDPAEPRLENAAPVPASATAASRSVTAVANRLVAMIRMAIASFVG